MFDPTAMLGGDLAEKLKNEFGIRVYDLIMTRRDRIVRPGRRA